jgi:hypothetical protein
MIEYSFIYFSLLLIYITVRVIVMIIADNKDVDETDLERQVIIEYYEGVKKQ